LHSSSPSSLNILRWSTRILSEIANRLLWTRIDGLFSICASPPKEGRLMKPARCIPMTWPKSRALKSRSAFCCDKGSFLASGWYFTVILDRRKSIFSRSVI
jgi:hypothetical protein